MKKFIFFVAFFLGASSFAFAQEKSSLPNVNIEQLKVQNIQLIEQNKILKASIDNTQNIYFSALGFAAAFLIAFLGVNVYFSKSRADEERKLHESRIDAKFSELELSNKENIDIKVNELVESNTKKIAQGFKSNITALENSIAGIKYDIAHMHFDLASDGNIKLSKAIEVIICSESRGCGFDWKTSGMLTEISELLNSGSSFDSTELSDVFRVLKSIKEPNRNLALEIEKKIISSSQ
ncbi:hypothetical protein [Vibrio genomosp. F10]|uniref:hypothetical protein n=1 Tax=Vibrio genomosp. F10 TaxID=723171 RepID=UPI0002DA293D|nr:hypothetical protein [Vibrio genomosp. F10]OEE84997.1 hypothetical protein A1QK_20090 [Vibrio genomosp. F10 str. 9ZD137]